MITYEITAVVEPELVDAYETYMRTRHIPDLLATGCFIHASFDRTTGGRYRIRYVARDRAELDRYLGSFAGDLRAHFSDRFPRGIEITRENWETVESWTA